jgi:hypothetical protein
MRAAIARGAARETAIIKARNAGATYAAIGKAVGLILLSQNVASNHD